MKEINDYKLTQRVTVGQLRAWMLKRDDDSKQSTVDLIEYRFNDRYLSAVRNNGGGFLKMAVACLAIETLESFKQGEIDTLGKSRRMFKEFFNSEKANFPGFSEIADEFYDNIRCGILHQAETRNAWRILRQGPLLDLNARAINADKFVKALSKSVDHYVSLLRIEEWSSKTWEGTIDKLNDICNNCEYNPVKPKKAAGQ